MTEFIEFLNKNAGALSAVFSGVVTVATVVYAWLTARLVQETRQMRQVQTEPRVQVTYRTRDEWINFLDVSVKNIGLGPAQNLRFEVKSLTDNPGAQELIDSLMKLGAFKGGLNYLGPNHQFSSFWSSLMDGNPTKVESRIHVICRYESVTGTKYEHDFILDLSELKGSSSIGEPPLLKIAKHLETIEKDLHSAITGFKRLGIDVYSQENRDAERVALEERFRQARESKE
jgi:hypothetical protein